MKYLKTLSLVVITITLTIIAYTNTLSIDVNNSGDCSTYYYEPSNLLSFRYKHQIGSLKRFNYLLLEDGQLVDEILIMPNTEYKLMQRSELALGKTKGTSNRIEYNSKYSPSFTYLNEEVYQQLVAMGIPENPTAWQTVDQYYAVANNTVVNFTTSDLIGGLTTCKEKND